MSNCSNAGLLVVWRPFRRYIVRLRPTITFPLVVISCCIHQVSFHPLMTLHCYVLVGQAGLEPAMRKAPDLQSGVVTNFPTDPYKYPQSLFNDHLQSRTGHVRNLMSWEYTHELLRLNTFMFWVLFHYLLGSTAHARNLLPHHNGIRLAYAFKGTLTRLSLHYQPCGLFTTATSF